jgi:hypothetical protein
VSSAERGPEIAVKSERGPWSHCAGVGWLAEHAKSPAIGCGVWKGGANLGPRT